MENFVNYTNSNVKYLRESAGISQSKLANDLEIDQSTLAKWENETRQITLEWSIKLSNYFGINVSDFISCDLKRKNNINDDDLIDKYKILFDKDNKLTDNQKEFIYNTIMEQHRKYDEEQENNIE